MRSLCLRCHRPESACYCSQLPPRLDTRTRVVFLQHPRERRVAIGTARMAHLALANSEIHQGVDFTGHSRLEELAKDPDSVAVLFPGEDAISVEDARARPPKTLIVVDGTWPQAKKVVSRNPVLAGLPRIGFVPRRPSNYRIRAEPADHCVSTIEAVVEILGLLEGQPEKFDTMLRAFEYMVDTQLGRQATRTSPNRRRIHYGPWRPPFELRSLAQAFENLVVFYGEANAHPTGADIPAELVHVVACRPASGERFEAIIAPERPLARSTTLHVELSEEVLRAGETRAAALARFEQFLRPDDELAVWTTFALDLLWEGGVARRPARNVRLATARALEGKAGGVEHAMELLSGPDVPRWAPGRAGTRIRALESVLRVLVERGQASEPMKRVKQRTGTEG
ncbi:DTW domain-containing protein [Myxococcus sp. MISCRS1]|uniref:tRNA-uridine aminocarboxypropyltransferase n=1 Tax=Myxococcus TaxID=32 RepID=UPI001CC17E4C|nr:tRNA-uridine aminocarboxypropyltransferase [Myxococcus sp. MISCRS1]MBZ4400480.1 DTW domain-containing protein [Myxococcus sp. AS-1-15]MBZ4412946.1 DTW domain-containing protein [Myxococcus sp. XM-1-1-1]MCY0997224.1 DTW domain-containing protein [Myxococcus sp. MISCRS1]